jgi:hypothetical protein
MSGTVVVQKKILKDFLTKTHVKMVSPIVTPTAPWIL